MTALSLSTARNSLPSAVEETPTPQRKRKIDDLIALANQSWANEKDGIASKKRHLTNVEPKASKEPLSPETLAYCQNLKQKMEEAMRKRQAPEVQAVNDRWKSLICS